LKVFSIVGTYYHRMTVSAISPTGSWGAVSLPEWTCYAGLRSPRLTF
jgi:hypothetical protein